MTAGKNARKRSVAESNARNSLELSPRTATQAMQLTALKKSNICLAFKVPALGRDIVVPQGLYRSTLNPSVDSSDCVNHELEKHDDP